MLTPKKSVLSRLQLRTFSRLRVRADADRGAGGLGRGGLLFHQGPRGAGGRATTEQTDGVSGGCPMRAERRTEKWSVWLAPSLEIIWKA